MPESPIGGLRRSKAAVLAHGPEPFAIHVRVNPPRERIGAGLADVFFGVSIAEVFLGIKFLQRDAGTGCVRHKRNLILSEIKIKYTLFLTQGVTALCLFFGCWWDWGWRDRK